jgi:hypothetical protein
MILMLVCTEGKVSEPAYIDALVAALGGQAPRNISKNVDVLPIPLSGNHGHAKLIEIANRAVELYSRDSIVSLAGEEDTIEKWIIVDYDDMDKHGVVVADLMAQAEAAGYILVVNKPKFEFFVLTQLAGIDAARSVSPALYASNINAYINELNETDKNNKGFSKGMLMPSYSKKKHKAKKLFDLLLGYHPELIDKAMALSIDINEDCYTEMPKIVRRIKELYDQD